MAVDWTNKDEVMQFINYCYTSCKTYRDDAAAWFTDAVFDNYKSNKTEAIAALIAGCRSLNNAVWYLNTYSGWPDYMYGVPHYLEYHSGISWKAICEAWVKDDFEGKEWTIACIDHMRKLMWDKPFKIVWASKPEAEAT